MRQFNKSRLCALITSFAVLISNAAVMPAVNVFAEDGVKTATIKLTDDFSSTISFVDIPLAEEKTTTISLSQNWSGNIDFTGVDTEFGESRSLSNAYNFETWKYETDIIAAIEAADGVDLPESPTIRYNNITVSYNWRFVPADGKTTAEQVAQIKSYLIQLVNELQIVIDNLPKEDKKDV